MTGEAGADHLYVINRVGRSPDHAVVAVRTDVGRVDVGRILAPCIRTVVAADAVAGDIDVIEICRDPCRV